MRGAFPQFVPPAVPGGVIFLPSTPDSMMCRRPAPRYRDVTYGSQFWYFLDPTGARVQRICPSGVGLKVDRVTLIGRGPPKLLPLDIWTKLIRYDDYECPLGNVDDALTSLDCRKLPQTSDLLRLPLETMWTILEMLDPPDIVALTSTCQIMFKLGCSLIAREMRMSSGDCAGHPLAILGNHSTSLPKTFLENDLAYQSIPSSNASGFDSGGTCKFYLPAGNVSKVMNYLDVAKWKYQPPKSQMAASNTWLSALDSDHNNITTSRSTRSKTTKEPAHTLLTTLLHRTNQTCSFDDPTSDSRATPYYLRNHTTHSLIRICNCPTPHITSHSNNPSEPTHPLTLDDIFTILTRHTTPLPNASPFESGPESWTTGPWAGHVFDIVSAARHAREYPVSSTSTPMWRDLTSAISTRALWEHDRLHFSARIAEIGKPRVRGRRAPKWALKARSDVRGVWLGYVDSLYEGVMRPFEGDGGEWEEVEGMVEVWRERLEGILAECEGRRRGWRAEKVGSGGLEKGKGKEKEMEGKQKGVRAGVRCSGRLRSGSGSGSATC